MGSFEIDGSVLARLYRRAKADRWDLTEREFSHALEAGIARALADQAPRSRDVTRHAESLHLEDLAVAAACAAGRDKAWEHFVREYRPLLYRAADHLDPSGGARETADSLYGELYGLTDSGGMRQSLFRYFHGRSSLATWLRAVLAQRYVDRIRAQRRLVPLPNEEISEALGVAVATPYDPDRPRYIALIKQTLGLAVARLDQRDRLRLGCYYAQQLTLAQIGRLLHEHEATVSRHLARTRRAIREDVERQLREVKLSEREIADCFACVADDAASIDLGQVFGMDERKEVSLDRSK
jgi:RNA polymerase sigma factor (sigma-70 family)